MITSAAYAIIATVVLAFSPDGGRTVPVPREERIVVERQDPSAEVTPYECQTMGQISVAKWLEEHPGYKIIKWRCPRPGVNEQGA